MKYIETNCYFCIQTRSITPFNYHIYNMKSIIFYILCVLLCTPPILTKAQNENKEVGKLLSPSRAFFVPHFYIKTQAGGAYDLGEAKFQDLVSPAAQFVWGYRFHELFGVRGTVSGLWARNRYAFPEAEYRWNFIQPAIEGEIDLTQLIMGLDPERQTSVYAFAGAGVAVAFHNDDAKLADKIYGIDFKKRWESLRYNPVVRAGLGFDYSILDNIAIGGEINVNMLPDYFNSKAGKRDNMDWHFNAVFGFKFTLGKSHGRTEPVYEQVSTEGYKQSTDTQSDFYELPVEDISFNVNIYFLINQSVIRDTQIGKLTQLISYLNEHPKAYIRLSGFADKETGNPEINMRLARERVEVVTEYLEEQGIAERRIRQIVKGDKVQPFNIPEHNRVCVCYVYDPDNPKPQKFDN